MVRDCVDDASHAESCSSQLSTHTAAAILNPAEKQIEKEKTHDWLADKVIIIKEVQSFTRIYIFSWIEHGYCVTLTGLSNILTVITFFFIIPIHLLSYTK